MSPPTSQQSSSRSMLQSFPSAFATSGAPHRRQHEPIHVEKAFFQKLKQFPSTKFSLAATQPPQPTQKASRSDGEHTKPNRNTFPSPIREQAHAHQPETVAPNQLLHSSPVPLSTFSKSHENVKHYQRKEFQPPFILRSFRLFRLRSEVGWGWCEWHLKAGDKEEKNHFTLFSKKPKFSIFRLRRYQQHLSHKHIRRRNYCDGWVATGVCVGGAFFSVT